MDIAFREGVWSAMRVYEVLPEPRLKGAVTQLTRFRWPQKSCSEAGARRRTAVVAVAASSFGQIRIVTMSAVAQVIGSTEIGTCCVGAASQCRAGWSVGSPGKTLPGRFCADRGRNRTDGWQQQTASKGSRDQPDGGAATVEIAHCLGGHCHQLCVEEFEEMMLH